MVEQKQAQLSLPQQCLLSGANRATLCYKPNPSNLEIDVKIANHISRLG